MTISKQSLKDSQGLKRLWLRFTAALMGLLRSSKHQHPNSNKSDLSNLFTHCREVKLGTFIDCLFLRNFTGLIRYGQATEENLLKAWEFIFQEYCDLSGSGSYHALFYLTREIYAESCKKDLIDLALHNLQDGPEPESIKVLRKFGYNYPFTEQTLKSDCEKVRSKARVIELTVKRLISEKEFKEKTFAKGATESDFRYEIASMVKFMGVPIDENTTTVMNYCMFRKLYDEEVMANKKRNGNK